MSYFVTVEENLIVYFPWYSTECNNVIPAGAQLLAMNIKHAPLDPVTMKVDVNAMKRMITRRTCVVSHTFTYFHVIL